MGPLRTVLIVAGLGAAIAAGVWFVYTSVSYGPLEERTGQVTRAEHVPEHEEEWTRRDEDGRERIERRRVGPSWLVIIAWDEGTYESRSQALYSQVKVGSEVKLHVRQRLWRSKPSGWSVQSVSPR